MAFQSEKNQFEKVYGRVFLSSNVHYEEQQCKHDSEYHEFKAIKEKKLLVEQARRSCTRVGSPVAQASNSGWTERRPCAKVKEVVGRSV